MRDHSSHIQLTREEAVEQTLAALDALPQGFGYRAVDDGAAANAAADANTAAGADFDATRDLVESVSLANSIGRVLAHDVRAVCDMPSALTCMMDSVALHYSDFEGLASGELPDTSSWVRGADWEFANTGVAMPKGFDTAIVIEHVQVSDDEQHITIDAAPSKIGAGTRPVGSSMKRGDVLAKAGSLITPDLAARIGSGNVGAVSVVRKPRVAFIPTGNELVAPGIPYDPKRTEGFAALGKNFETNSILVRGKVEAWGGVFMPCDIAADDYDLIKTAIEAAAQIADIVVLNAGSSKGSDDWCIEVLEEIGHVICHQTNHGPGHHSSYAIVGGVPIVGISGPSAGASFTLNFYLRPIMRRFLGLEPEVDKVPVRLAEPFPAPPHHGKGHGGKDSGAASGAGGAGGAGDGSRQARGEDRPREGLDGEWGKPAFFGIKLLKVEHAPDGSLVGHPIDGRPGSAESFCANAYAMIGNGPGVEPPRAGDVVMAEWR